MNCAEVLAIAPPEPEGEEPRLPGYLPGKGPSKKNVLFRKAVGYLLHMGVDVEFGEGDALPSIPPANIERYKGVLVAASDLPRLKPYLSKFRGLEEWHFTGAGVSVTFYHESGKPILLAFDYFDPNFYYTCPPLERFVIDAELTLESPSLQERMLRRKDEHIQRALAEHLMSVDRADWTDVCSYIASSLFDTWEITREPSILNYLTWLFDKAIDNISFEDGIPRLKQKRPGTPIEFGFLLSLPTLVKLYKATGDKRYLATLESGLPYAFSPVHFTPTQNWSPFLKGVHGVVAVAAFFDKLPQIEDALLTYCRAGEEALMDKKTGLWKYFTYRGRTTPWCPAHGSALNLFHLMQILDHYPPSRLGYEFFAEMTRKITRSILPYQDESGFWRTVFDKETPPHTDYTATFAHAFLKGYRLGVLDRAYLERGRRAWQFTKTRTFAGGAFGCRGGLAHSLNFYYYLFRPIFYDYLEGPPVWVLSAANEAVRMHRTRELRDG